MRVMVLLRVMVLFKHGVAKPAVAWFLIIYLHFVSVKWSSPGLGAGLLWFIHSGVVGDISKCNHLLKWSFHIFNLIVSVYNFIG